MARRIVYVGGPQTKALARVFRDEFADDAQDIVAFVGREALARDNARRVVDVSDILVVERDDDGDALPEGMAPERAEIIRVPAVCAPFLWPYAGRPHPENVASAALPEGPYPAEQGDSYLDRMMADGVAPDQAVARYLALDIVAEADVERRLSESLERQAALDEATGGDLADFIRNRFATTYLFVSRTRPRLPLFRRVASAVFARLGVAEAAVGRLRAVPFSVTSQPIHPGIIAHFGLAAPAPDHRYPMLDEGLFTFSEYCHRYLRFAWNAALHEGMALMESDPAAALVKLREGLERSPESRAGQRALSEVEAALAAPVVASVTRRAVARLPAVPASEPPPWVAANKPRWFPTLPPAGPVSQAALPAPVEVIPAPVEAFVTIGVLGEGKAAAYSPVAYVELPPFGLAQAEEALPARKRDRFKPLAPDLEMISVLPRLLLTLEALTGTIARPFASMPETMPPPPPRPELPPEIFIETPQLGVWGRVVRMFKG